MRVLRVIDGASLSSPGNEHVHGLKSNCGTLCRFRHHEPRTIAMPKSRGVVDSWDEFLQTSRHLAHDRRGDCVEHNRRTRLGHSFEFSNERLRRAPTSCMRRACAISKQRCHPGESPRSGSSTPISRASRAYDHAGPALNAMFSTESARAGGRGGARRRAQGGPVRGPLHGIPIILKDNYGTRDFPTSARNDRAREHAHA